MACPQHFAKKVSFAEPAQYYFIPGDFGAGAIVQLTDNLSLDFAYSAAEPGDSSDGSGLFNGDSGRAR